jgi:hypothetical protein
MGKTKQKNKGFKPLVNVDKTRGLNPLFSDGLFGCPKSEVSGCIEIERRANHA